MALSRAELPSNPSDLEGLEPFFETVTATVTSTPTNTTQDVVTVTTTPIDWTLKEAAERLGVSTNTIRNRVKARELHGYKVLGQNGPEWRITPPADTLTTAAPKVEGLQALLQVIDSQARHIETMTKQLDANTIQLKAAGDVVTYLHEQLRDKDSQIKLLTDSQHKASLWQRLYGWFTRSKE
jgi:excisionase family DNA binding protein